MKYKESFMKVIYKAASKKKISRRRLTTSYVSLFLAFTVLVGATISWFTFQNRATVDSDTFSLEAASNLSVKDGETISNYIRLEDVYLEEVSSVDGRNMFLPTKGTFTSDTFSMVFREGNVGDKNKKYVYKDFRLGSHSAINVYVKSYRIQVDDQVFNGSTEIILDEETGKPLDRVRHNKCPIRIAFIENSLEQPVVIDPTAIINDYAQKFDAVNSTDDNGLATTAVSNAHSFADYYYGLGEPLFRLDGENDLDVTMVAWLEGTDENGRIYAGKDIKIEIELESNWSGMETVTFVDETLGDNQALNDPNPLKWVGGDGHLVTMSYEDTTTADIYGKHPVRTVVMNPTKYVDDPNLPSGKRPIEWEAPIPSVVVSNITFNRYDSANEIIYNAWYTKTGVEDIWDGKTDKLKPLQESRIVDGKRQLVYTAIRGNGYQKTDNVVERLSASAGYWGYHDDDLNADQNIYVGFKLDTSSHTDIADKIADGYEMYIRLGDNNMYKINYVSGNDFEITGMEVPAGSMTKRFCLKKDHETIYYPLDRALFLKNNATYIFTLGDDGIFYRQ